MSAPTIHTHNATDTAGLSSPHPTEAHQRAGDWVQIQKADLDRHFLSGEFFISRAALATLSGDGPTLYDVLDGFNGHPDSVHVGDTRRINAQLQAFFGFDADKPNARAFFVQIDLIPQAEQREAVGQPSLTEIFGDPIHVVTRAQLIEDGELVDVSTMAAEAGFKTPVAITRAAWADCVEWSEADTQRQTHQDEEGRLWDVLWMCLQVARVAKAQSAFGFKLYRIPRGGRGLRARLTSLKACIGPGNAGEPVVTIMLPSED